MARAKPAWRKVLNARFLRWWLLGRLVAVLPSIGRLLAFFPKPIDMVDGADTVLADDLDLVSPDTFAPDMDFLSLCQPNDSRAPEVRLPDGVVRGRRTCLYDRPWIDMNNGSVLLPKSGQTVLVRGAKANWNATSARPFRRRITIEGRVLAPLVTRNYFHVLTENALRILDLLEAGRVAEKPLTIVRPVNGVAVEDAFYRGLVSLYEGVSVETVPTGSLVLPTQGVVHFPCDNYWEWPPVTPDLADLLGAVFDEVYGRSAAAKGPARLYLSRDGTKLRDPNNAGKLSIALEAVGFENFVATDANHPAQIARFRAARTIVGVHGAGLTNLLFCHPGARVIEIFPGNFVKSTYWHLARRLNLHYSPVIAGPGDYNQRFDVDIDAVLAALEEV